MAKTVAANNDPLKLKLRDHTHTYQGRLTDYESATLIPRWNDVGTFSITAALNSPGAKWLQPGNGVSSPLPDGSTFSGFIDDYEYTMENGVKKVICSGVEDTAFLRDYFLLPTPSKPFTQQQDAATYNRTGLLEAVIKGTVQDQMGTGTFPARRFPGLTVASTIGWGNPWTMFGRYDNLWDKIQAALAPNSCSASFVNANGAWVFDVLRPHNDSSTARFSEAIGNLTKVSLKRQRPTATSLAVAGQGQGTARNVKQFSQPANGRDPDWDAYVEQFVDQRNTNDANDLAKAGADKLAAGAATTLVTAEVIDTPSMRIGEQYRLGSYATIVVEGVSYVDLVTEIKYESAADKFTVTPTIGGTEAKYRRVKNQAKLVRDLQKRILNLEGSL